MRAHDEFGTTVRMRAGSEEVAKPTTRALPSTCLRLRACLYGLNLKSPSARSLALTS